MAKAWQQIRCTACLRGTNRKPMRKKGRPKKDLITKECDGISMLCLDSRNGESSTIIVIVNIQTCLGSTYLARSRAIKMQSREQIHLNSQIMRTRSTFAFYLMSWNSIIKVSVAEVSINDEINFNKNENQSDDLSSSL